MKKISTAASDKIGKVEGQRLTVGLDVGDRSSWYCVLDEAGAVLLEQKLPTTAKAMKEIFGKMPRSRIALETGMHSPWVSRLLMKLEELNRHQQIDPGPFLSAYVGMGDKEQAFAWLEKAYSQHSNALTALKVEPCYDSLRSDPRFQELMRRVRLAQ